MVRRMVRDLDIPVEIEVLPIVREPDGLAMSSRNAYLGPDERRRAVALSRAVEAAEAAAARGETRASAALEAAAAELERGGDRARIPRGPRCREPRAGGELQRATGPGRGGGAGR